MNTFLFTWNPKNWEWTDLPQACVEVNSEESYICTWSCVNRRRIKIGDRAFLMRLGKSPKGIIGSGEIVSEPEEGLHWDVKRQMQGDTYFYAKIKFDTLNDLPLLGENILLTPPFSSYNWFPQSSGQIVKPDAAKLIEEKWEEITGRKFIQTNKENSGMSEGALKTKSVNYYERDPYARTECIEFYGAKCVICDFQFEDKYGDLGKEYIHVHHLTPMSNYETEHEIDPIEDLRPVCPNCHAMLHRKNPPYTPDELKEIIDVGLGGEPTASMETCVGE